MGYGDAGYLATGNRFGKLLTPHMDALTAAGMSFTDAYAGAPTCSPSRCSLMTGLHSGHCSVRDNGQEPLARGEIGFPTLLRARGYHTRHIGKWGLGGWGSGGSPLDKGFESYYGQLDNYQCHDYYPSYMDVGELRPGNRSMVRRMPIAANEGASEEKCGVDRLECAWTGDLWTAEARAFILGHASAAVARGDMPQPWLLYIAHTAPHSGGVGTQEEGMPPVPRVGSGPYASRHDMGPEVSYAAAITELDRQLGLVLEALETAGEAEHTVVFFASDNGASSEGGHDYLTFNSSGPLSGRKRSLHEGGHRTPLIVRWPGQIARGTTSAQQFAFYDFMATALELAGGDPSRDLPPDQKDGDSLLPTLLGRPQAQKAFVYHEACRPWEKKHGWGQALRVGNWSGVCLGSVQETEGPACTQATFLLYNLDNDLAQAHNVAAQHPDIVQSMLAKMRTVAITIHVAFERTVLKYAGLYDDTVTVKSIVDANLAKACESAARTCVLGGER